jgi:hypothetical protein
MPPRKRKATKREETFEVEKIIGKRGAGDKLEYRVKWKHFGVGDATWELHQNLISDGCASIVEAFEAAATTIVISDDDDDPPPKQAKREGKKAVATSAASAADEDVLLGHLISRCVGIQHCARQSRAAAAPPTIKARAFGPDLAQTTATASAPTRSRCGCSASRTTRAQSASAVPALCHARVPASVRVELAALM